LYDTKFNPKLKLLQKLEANKNNDKLTVNDDGDGWSDDGDDGFGDDDDDDDDDDGWDDDGDGDWDDDESASLTRSAIATDSADDEWTRWRVIQKRWEQKEAALRAAAVDRAATGIDSKTNELFSSAAASKILTKALLRFMKNPSPGVQVEPIDDSIYNWRVCLSDFDKSSSLYKDMMKLKTRYGYDYVELEFRFTIDLYPFYPPSVRLVRPRLANFMMARIVCMDELQLSKWNPARSLSDIFDSIKRILTKFSKVDDDGDLNDPANTDPPYTELEFQLMRLGMLTNIQPRVTAVITDDDAKMLPSFGMAKLSKGSEQKQAFVKPDTATQDSWNKAYTDDRWKKGTGYGHGGQTDFDITAWLAAQKKKDSEILELGDSVLKQLRGTSISAVTINAVEMSCLVPFINSYLVQESITEMERHPRVFHSVFNLVGAMAQHPALHHLLSDLEDQPRSICDMMIAIAKRARIVEKMAGGGATTTTARLSSSASTPASGDVLNEDGLSLTQSILYVSALVESATKSAAATTPDATSTSDSSAASASAHTHSSAPSESSVDADCTLSDSKDSDAEYLAVLRGLQFDYVDTLSGYHYRSKTSKLTRKAMKRLAMEYGDLSKSLPLTNESAIFLRVHEEEFNRCQMLIIAPTDTPYSRGCFLFDVFFPSEYPNVAPKVNLQTTGNGSVRFNPNLYNCGKVCLSLLGTWSGQAGEEWNAATSTFLQVAVSIQALIFVPQPYFNEPGYEREIGTSAGDKHSSDYNKVIEIATLRHAMIGMLEHPPAGFEDIVKAHFYVQKDNILKDLHEWGSHQGAPFNAELSKFTGLVDKLESPF
jgi:ubiquitin-protein ligase